MPLSSSSDITGTRRRYARVQSPSHFRVYKANRFRNWSTVRSSLWNSSLLINGPLPLSSGPACCEVHCWLVETAVRAAEETTSGSGEERGGREASRRGFFARPSVVPSFYDVRISMGAWFCGVPVMAGLFLLATAREGGGRIVLSGGPVAARHPSVALVSVGCRPVAT